MGEFTDGEVGWKQTVPCVSKHTKCQSGGSAMAGELLDARVADIFSAPLKPSSSSSFLFLSSSSPSARSARTLRKEDEISVTPLTPPCLPPKAVGRPLPLPRRRQLVPSHRPTTTQTPDGFSPLIAPASPVDLSEGPPRLLLRLHPETTNLLKCLTNQYTPVMSCSPIASGIALETNVFLEYLVETRIFFMLL